MGIRQTMTNCSRRRLFLSIILSLIICFLSGASSPLLAVETLEVIVHGVEGDALGNVQAALAIPQGLVQDGKVNKPWLDYFKGEAAGKVRTALEPFGYYNSQVTVKLETSDRKNYRLLVDIEAGEPVRVITVNVSVEGPGSGDEKLRKLVKEFPIHKGDILLQQKYEEGKGGLKAEAIKLGYIDADFPVKKILVSEKENTAQIEIKLDTGPRYRFGKTTIEGAPSYPDKFLRRYLTFKEGDIFSYDKLGETQFNLVNSDRFKEVIVSPEKEKVQDHTLPVLMQLRPSPPKRLRFGIGYGTDTGARFSIRYTDLNMFHAGNELHTELNISQRLQGLAAGYVIPSPKDINSSNSLQLDLNREKVKTYETKLASLEGDRTRSFGKGRLGTLYLRLLDERSTIARETPKAFLVMPGVRFSVRQFDNLIRPTHGYQYNIELRGTHEYLGSDMALFQVLAGGNILIPLPWRLSVKSRLQGALTFEDKSVTRLPASLRFFAGGDQSVRGYDYQSLGPKNEKGEVIGGKDLIVGSVELERAIFADWGIVTFYDAGNAFNSFSDITLFEGVGIGVRYYSPVGPIRLDLAREIGVSNPKFKIHFGFGFEL
jgi:translocation and assembly module TamA